MDSQNDFSKSQSEEDREVNHITDSSSSEKSFLDNSEVSSHEESSIEKVTENVVEEVNESSDVSRKSSTDESKGSHEASKTSSVKSGDDSKIESLDASYKSSVEGSESYLRTSVEKKEDVEFDNNKFGYSAVSSVPATVVSNTQGVNSDKIFANPFDTNMESGEKMLRMFMLLGIFPLPVVGWIVGLLSSFKIKKKKRIHKILISMLFLFTLVAIIIAMVLLGYFLVKNSKDKSSSSEKNDSIPAVVISKPKVDGQYNNGSLLDEGMAFERNFKHPDDFSDINLLLDEDTDKKFEYVLPLPKGVYTVSPAMKIPPTIISAQKKDFVFIPPTYLKAPVTDSNTEKDIKYDFFEYKHPKSKKEMVIILSGLNANWRLHDMFKFSEYVDHSIKVFHIHKQLTKFDINKVVTGIKDAIKYKTDVTLVAEINKDHLKEFGSTFSTMKVKRLLAINTQAKCEKKTLKSEPVEFIGLNDKKIDCIRKVDFPLMLIKNGQLKLTSRNAKLTDLESYLSNEDCETRMSESKATKEYLDKLYVAFRKFVSMTSVSEKDTLIKDVLCSKAK